MLVIAHFKLYLTEGLNIHQVENDSCDFLYVCRINLVNQLNQFFIFLFKFFRVFFSQLILAYYYATMLAFTYINQVYNTNNNIYYKIRNTFFQIILIYNIL